MWCFPLCSLCARTRLRCVFSVDTVILHTNKTRAMDRAHFPLHPNHTPPSLLTIPTPSPFTQTPYQGYGQSHFPLYIQITLLLVLLLYLPLPFSPKPHSIHPSAIPEAQLFKLSSSHTRLSDSCLFHVAEFFKLSSLERQSIPGDQYFIFCLSSLFHAKINRVS